jgi:uncharacterized protein YbcC (UPF0753/DUF2309 family)
MDYEDLKDLIRKSCPPILNSSYHVSEFQERHTEKKTYKQKNDVLNFKEYFLKRMKTCSLCLWICRRRGIFYGMSLLARTLIPGYLYRFSNKNAAVYESVLNHRLGTGVPVNRQM